MKGVGDNIFCLSDIPDKFSGATIVYLFINRIKTLNF